MNDKLIRVGAIGMIGVAMTVGYSLMQSTSASTGPQVNIPMTAKDLKPQLETTEAALTGDTDVMPLDTDGPFELAQPTPRIGGLGSEAPQMANLDAGVPQFNAFQTSVPSIGSGITDLEAELSGAQLTNSDFGAMDECEPLMRLDVEPDAMLRLLVSAPCNAGEAIEIAHDGLVYKLGIDNDGGVLSTIPALSTDASVTVSFTNGIALTETINVAEAANYRRVAVVGDTMLDLELHAYESGALFGSDGHLHIGNLGTAGISEGRMYVLGNTQVLGPMFAQVYSVQASQFNVDLMVEAVISSDNCGLDRSAVALISDGNSVTQKSFEIALPNCDAVGEFVIMPGLFETAQS